MNTLISILCEGPHDVAFITKILRCSGYISSDSLKIDQYPAPINQLILKEVSNTDVKNLNIQEVRRSIIPSTTLRQGNIFLFIYSLGGDNKVDARQDFLSKLIALIPQEGEISVESNYKLGIVYLLDSDDKGVAKRVAELNNEIERISGLKPFTGHMQEKDLMGLKIGCLVFTDDGGENGKLEDVLIPLMRQKNESIFEDAEEYLTKHFSKDRCGKKFDFGKSTIGIVGQLQESGASNVVCIGRTDYIDADKVTAHPRCTEIIEYLNDFIHN